MVAYRGEGIGVRYGNKREQMNKSRGEGPHTDDHDSGPPQWRVIKGTL